MRLGPIVLMVLTTTTAAAESDATRARDVLRANCYECHGQRRESDPNFDVTDYGYLTNRVSGLIVPGAPDSSRIVRRATGDRPEMPPRDKQRRQLTKDEQAALIAWVKNGAKPWDAPRAERELLDDSYAVKTIGLYAASQPVGELHNYRYVSLVPLWNEGLVEEDLATVHQAVSKVCNSAIDPDHLIKQDTPAAVLDELGLVMRIDLRDYGWTAEDWREIAALYSYGVPRSGALRADWFCWALSRPRIYYALTGTPARELELEKKLGVDRGAASIRAGITDSPVSAHDRLFIRRETRYGGYYYRGLNTLNAKPVIMNALDFPHDYVTALYELPNGRPAFAAFEVEEGKEDEQRRNGVRSNDVDPRAEADPSKTSGSFTPLVPVSCVTCHVTAIQPNVRDVVRDGAVVKSRAELADIRRLFPPQEDLTKVLMADRKKYVDAFAVDEPLKPVVLRYNRPLDLPHAAADRGVSENALARLIRDRTELQALGLRPLLDGRTVTRDAWHGQARRVTQLLGKE